MNEIIESPRVSLHRPLNLLLKLTACLLLRDVKIKAIYHKLDVIILL